MDADYLQILSETREFYDSAWDKLIIAISILGGIVGFLIPYILGLGQNKKNKETIKAFEEKYEKYLPIFEDLKADVDKYEAIKKQLKYENKTDDLGVSNAISESNSKYAGQFKFLNSHTTNNYL